MQYSCNANQDMIDRSIISSSPSSPDKKIDKVTVLPIRDLFQPLHQSIGQAKSSVLRSNCHLKLDFMFWAFPCPWILCENISYFAASSSSSFLPLLNHPHRGDMPMPILIEPLGLAHDVAHQVPGRRFCHLEVLRPSCHVLKKIYMILTVS